MEVTSFAAINKFQPFNVAISSNVLFLLVGARLPPCPLGTRDLPPPAQGRGLEYRGGRGALGCELRVGGALSALFTIGKQCVLSQCLNEEWGGLAPACHEGPGPHDGWRWGP